jgi:hypothetical protein
MACVCFLPRSTRRVRSVHKLSCSLVRSLYPFLHSVHVLLSCLVLVFCLLCVTTNTNLFSFALAPQTTDFADRCLPNHFRISPSIFHPPAHIPFSFLSQSKPTCQEFLFYSPFVFQTSSQRHWPYARSLFLSFLLLLAGDINPNPGPSATKCLNFAHANVRSAASVTPDINKPAIIQDFVLTNNIDFLAMTETWLSPSSPQSTLNSLTPPSYSLQHVPRLLGVGGGVALLHKTDLHTSQVPTPTFSTFESLCVRVALPSTSLTVLTIYRPPSSSKPQFLADFATLLETLASSPSELLITGDFNFHVDQSVPTTDIPFLELLDTFSLQQHVQFPTHTSSHTLDLLITRLSSQLITSVSSCDLGISDHLAISSSLSIPVKLRPPRITKSVRCYHSIDPICFSNDIKTSSLYTSPADSLTCYHDQFNSTLWN